MRKRNSPKLMFLLCVALGLSGIGSATWVHISFNMWLYKDLPFNWNSVFVSIIILLAMFMIGIYAYNKEK